MGYSIENFTLKEIKNLSYSDKIIPSFYWVFSLGKDWEYVELYDLLSKFNNPDNNSNYRLLGNYFVKSGQNPVPKNNTTKRKLLSSTNSLNDLDENFFNQTDQEFDKCLLLISSNHPQPGWGLIIKVDNIDDVLSKIDDVLEQEQFSSLVKLNKELNENYIKRKDLQNNKPIEPTNEKFTILNEIRSNCIAILLSNTRGTKNYNNINKLSNSANNLSKFANDIRLESLENLNLNKYKICFNLLETNIDYESIFKNKKDELIANIQNLKLYFENLPRNMKEVLSIILYLNHEEIIRLTSDPINFIKEEIQNAYKEIEKIKTDLSELIMKEKDTLDASMTDYTEKYLAWNNTYLLGNPTYKKQASDLVENMWDGSAKFLISLEKKFGADVKSISWDKPRMIGWKTSLCLEKPRLVGLNKYISKKFNVRSEELNNDGDQILNGNYFSDYLHYVFLKNSSAFFNTRAIAEEMIEEYYSYNEKIDIINFLGYNKEIDPSDSNEFLTALGWPRESLINYDTALISFFEKNITSEKLVLSNPQKGTWIDLRICMESYFKDIIRIISSNMEMSKISDCVQLHNKEFVFKMFNGVSSNSWEKEVENIVCGSAILLIKALGKDWRPHEDWDTLESNVNKILKVLNPKEHHKTIITPDDAVAIELNKLFPSFFDSIKRIFTEMPWHMTTNSQFWSNPSIISGQAWSHDYPNKKEIRILVWEGKDTVKLNKEFLIWNPKKINPIMTDYNILK